MITVFFPRQTNGNSMTIYERHKVRLTIARNQKRHGHMQIAQRFFFFFFPSFPKFMLLRFIILQRHTAFQTIKLLKHATSFATLSRMIFFLAPHRTQLGVSSVINQIQVLHFFSASSLLTNQRTALVSSLAQGKSPLWQLLDLK